MSFTKVAPAGIGTEPGDGYRIGDSFLHATGLSLGSGTTISHSGSASFSGIVTASAFFGDGSGLEGVSSSGIGTPLSDDDTSELNKVYYVNQELSIGSTVTVNHPDSAIASYTHYQDLVVKDNADFIVTDGDTFIPDVLGINTSSLPNPVSSATGGRIRAGTITNAGANGAPNFPNGVTGTSATFTTGTFTGNLNVGGTLTYEDVTNIDSVGIITARSGIRIGATGANTLITGNGVGIGIGITTPTEELHIRAATPVIRLEDGDNAKQSQIVGSDGNLRLDADNNNAIADTNIAFRTDGGERLRIGPVGQLGIGGANYGTSGQVLTSQGSGSAVQWATPSSGLAMADMWRLTTTYSIPNNSTAILSTANWERPDQADGFAQLGTGMSVNSSDHAAGVWTFPSTGFYLVTYNGIVYNGSNDPYEVLIRMEFCENGSTFNIQSRIFGSGEQGNYNPMSGQSLVDVTDTSNVKMRLRVYSANANSTLQGNSNENRNYFTVIRLGDT